MSVNLARLGWVGVAIEATPGVPANPTDYTPYTANTIQGKHTPITDISVRGIRNKNFSTVIGKKWGEGDLTVNLDPVYSGYFFKMAVGSENSAQNASTGVYDHTFTVNQNTTPTVATIYVDKVSYREFYPYSTMDTLEIAVKDGLATLKSSIKSQFPATSSSGTLTTSSGTVFTFKDFTVQFGATLAAAQVAAATPVTNFNLKIKNNPTALYQSGSPVPTGYAYGDIEVEGEYDLFLQSQAEVNNYYNLTKQYAIFTFTGNGIGGGYLEQVQVTVYQMSLKDQPLETGIDNLFAIKSNFLAEYSVSDAKTLQILCRNRKSTTY